MDNLVRLLLRFLLVPLGFTAAAVAGSLVVMVASWQLIDVATSGREHGVGDAIFAAVVGSAVLVVFVSVFMLLPASVGILISEAFAIRSWIFHVLNGVVSAWLGLQLYHAVAGGTQAIDQPMVIVAAGIAGGFAYWAVAGFSAGFYKPVFRRDPVADSVPATSR
jgi:hypothetical protein